jgi:hypothetical protein
MATAIVGGAAAISAIGGWVYKHYSDTKRLEARMTIYDQMIADGISPEVAANRVYGGGSEIGGIINKVLMITLIGGGVYLVAKFA